jgi:hypothetical protein
VVEVEVVIAVIVMVGVEVVEEEPVVEVHKVLVDNTVEVL